MRPLCAARTHRHATLQRSSSLGPCLPATSTYTGRAVPRRSPCFTSSSTPATSTSSSSSSGASSAVAPSPGYGSTNPEAGQQPLKPKPTRPQQQQPTSSSNSSSSNTAAAQAAVGSSMARRGTPAAAAGAAGGSSPPLCGDALSLFAGAMPKSEIGALRFLQQYPHCDGRGVVVAIFDTGVDPSAAGLQETTDGKPKVIDVMDCTGSGDVDTSTVVAADLPGFIAGASGRQLALNPDWVNPSGQWHVGCRRLFELFPKQLQTRVKEQRKKAFDEAQRAAVAAAAADLAAAGKTPQQPSKGSSSSSGTQSEESAGATAASAATAAAAGPPPPSKSELEARLTYLQDAYKSYDDAGPVVECVVWHDGSTWRVALDTSDMYSDYSSSSSSSSSATTSPAVEGSENTTSGTNANTEAEEGTKQQQQQQRRPGALADFVPLSDFKVERQYGRFSDQDGCTYAVKVYDEGNTLSIVVDAGAHGTHVAGIVAAHFPDDPAANGMAPGAQIISCKIGDSRLGSMETGTGLVRALAAAMEAGADVINMSYGEATTRPDVGRAIDIAAEAVNRAGIIFVASAGNAGPALGTVGAPGGTSSALLGVGAYVSPQLAAAGHSARQGVLPGGGQQYTWSSRGPAPDGGGGVVLSAPGGAIAPVPGWTLQKRQLMNGTSMASPCAAGGIALLLSGLKAHGAGAHSAPGSSSSTTADSAAAAAAADSADEKQQQQQQWISPNRVRRAVEATCLPLGGDSPDAVLTYGRGLLQVDAAFEYLLNSAEVDLPDARYAVSVSGGPGGSVGLGVTRRGVYMRQPHEAAAAATYTVNVTPTLHEDAPVSAKLSVEEPLVLRSTAGWAECPPLLLLHANGRSFELKVDPTGLAPGLHYAELHALNPDQEWRGPLFRVPITVIKPQDLLHTPDVDPPPTAAPAAAAAESPPSGSPAAALSDFGTIVPGGASGFSGGVEAGFSGVDVPPHTLRLGPLGLGPGQEVRRFVVVPAGATWAEIVVRTGGSFSTPKMFMLRATQVVPDVRYSDTEWRSSLTLSPNSEYSTAFKVVGDCTLELTLSQFWSSLGSSSLEVELAFHGLGVEPAAGVLGAGGHAAAAGAGLLLDAAAGPLKLLVSSPLRRQRIKPEAKLTHLNLTLKPQASALEPLLDPRDSLPGGRVAYRLLLSYSFELAEGGKYKASLPLTNRYLYDSPLESQLTQLFDARQRLLYTGDAVPGEEVALAKGQHSARVALRHDDRALLDKLKGTCLVLSRKLDPAVPVPVYGSHAAAVAGGAAAGEAVLSAGDRLMLWLGPAAEDKLPKDATGKVFDGVLSLGQLRRGSGAAPAATPFACLPPPAAADKGGGKKEDSSSSSRPVKTPAERVSEAVRDAKLALLRELKADQAEEAAAAEALLRELLADWPKHLPLLLEVLKSRDSAAKGDERPAKLPSVIAAAAAVIDAINTTELAAFTAMRPPAEQDDSSSSSSSASDKTTDGDGGDSSSSGTAKPPYKQQKVEKDAEKAALLEALRLKLKAQLDQAEGAPASEAAAAAAAVAGTAAVLRQWVDTAADKDYLLLHARVEAAVGRPACALPALDKLLSPSDEVPGSSAPEAAALKQQLLQRLGWQHWRAYEQAWDRVRFPQKLPPV